MSHMFSFSPPRGGGREALLKINLKDVEVCPELDINDIAERLDGYSGADITNVCRSVGSLVIVHVALNTCLLFEFLFLISVVPGTKSRCC